MPSKRPLYPIWNEMHQRCYNSNHPKYHRYGGRGITVCSAWNELEKFVADMGPKPEDGTLDRINNDGNYEPSNCRWATQKQQANNRENSFLDEEVAAEMKRLRHEGMSLQKIATRFSTSRSRVGRICRGE